jgi:hypothetical protein
MGILKQDTRLVMRCESRNFIGILDEGQSQGFNHILIQTTQKVDTSPLQGLGQLNRRQGVVCAVSRNRTPCGIE